VFLVGEHIRGLQDPLEGRFGRVVGFDDLGALTMLVNQLHGGKKPVDKFSPFILVEIVEPEDDLGVVEAFITQVLANEAPIFAFDVRVIVFVIFSGTSIVNGEIFFETAVISDRYSMPRWIPISDNSLWTAHKDNASAKAAYRPSDVWNRSNWCVAK
jgi:hypothetical protein